MQTHEEIKTRLLQRRHDLLSRYQDEVARAAEELETREVEQVDNATELWDARVLSVLGDTDAQAIEQIVAALRRLDNGTYGVCSECAGTIEAQRLFALPETTICFDCADLAERSTVPLGRRRAG